MIGSNLALVREATVKDYDLANGLVRIVIDLAKGDAFSRVHDMPIPASWTGPSGEFAGGLPVVGAALRVAMTQGGAWAALAYTPNTGLVGNKESIAVSGFRTNVMSALQPGRHLIQVKDNIRHIVDPRIGVVFGDPTQNVQADPKASILSNTFENNMAFTEANRAVIGPVFRDIQANATRNVSGSALSSHEYQYSLTEIGLDPRTLAGDSFTRNPGFNESREIVYEFRNSFDFTDDLTERKIYDNELLQSAPSYFPRTQSRADALSLSLIEPNQLIETIKGTVVDIYGNVVDLNRTVLPSGVVSGLSFGNNEQSAADTFSKLREQTRKSIAYHFEINARKSELPTIDNLDLFIDDNADYSRNRSRFFFDVDKEGQFRLNVPASSETGNIGLTVRHENYSTISASTNETDPRALVRNIDNQDIFLDSFGIGVIGLKGSSEELAGFVAPVDRITGNQIKLGTVFHDLSNTLNFHAIAKPIPQYPQSILNTIPPVTKLFEPEIIVSGDGANAGGRSGTITLDGHLSFNIGANTSDRQSLWLDMAGGAVTNFGRDTRDVSWAGRFDGDVLLQVGGPTINSDSRFINLNNGDRNGTFDLRIFMNNGMHILRIDQHGISCFTPGRLDLVADQDVRIMSRRGNMYLGGENVYFYPDNKGGARWVARKPGKTID